MKKAKRTIVAILAAVLCFGVAGAFTGCNQKEKVFTILMLEGGRGRQYVDDLVTEFKKTYDGEVDVVAGPSATIESELTNRINAGNYPDLIILNLNMPNTSVETLIQGRNLEDLSGLLGETVAGEETTINDKLVDGLLNSYTTQPYGDGKTYLLPAFYSPTGMFYDASRFGEGKGQYTLPETWEEFFALGAQLNAAQTGNVATDTAPDLFTYPTAGYFDSVFYAVLADYAGEEKYMQALGYTDGIWEDTDVKAALTQIVSLKDYTLSTTAANATKENFSKNQQAVIGESDSSAKGTALFMPNGDWLPGEMAGTTPEGFEWGFMPIPRKDKDGSGYVTTYVETMMVHAKGEFKQAAKDFIKLYYSDKGAEIVAKANGAIIPTKAALENAAANGVAQSTIDMYDVYDGNAAVIGNFAATKPVPDLVWADLLFNDLNENVFAITVTKDVTTLVNEWSATLEAASDQLRANIIR